MIVTSCHDLIEIMIAMSVPPSEQNQSFFYQAVDNCKTPFPSPTSIGCECYLIAAVAWSVLQSPLDRPHSPAANDCRWVKADKALPHGRLHHIAAVQCRTVNDRHQEF